MYALAPPVSNIVFDRRWPRRVHIMKADSRPSIQGDLMHRCSTASFGIVYIALTSLVAPAGDKKASTPAVPLLILDAQRKDVKLKGWHLTAGVRKLPVDGGGKKGPDYLEFREDTSTTYENGI